MVCSLLTIPNSLYSIKYLSTTITWYLSPPITPLTYSIETLRNYFSHYGTLSDAVIMRDKFTGRSRGFGFVLFDDPQSVDTVINEQHAIDGRNVCGRSSVTPSTAVKRSQDSSCI